MIQGDGVQVAGGDREPELETYLTFTSLLWVTYLMEGSERIFNGPFSTRVESEQYM